MSLILDALKKSEAERQRGMPPTLHAHFSAPRRARRAPWVAGAGAVLLVAGLAGSWMWLARGRADAGLEGADGQVASAGAAVAGDDTRLAANAQPAAPAAPDAVSRDLPVDTAVASVPVATSAAAESAFGGVAGDGAGGTVSGGGLPLPQRAMLYTPTVTPTAETAAADPAPVAAPPVPVEVPAPVVAAPAMPTQVTASPPPPPKMDEVAMPVVAADTPAAAASTPGKPEEVLPNVFQLPYATRKDLPKLELSMHVFSPDASERFIVLNGKRYTLETPAPGPELTLLDIVADGAVLEFRGERFLLPRQTY